jgi:hypothetical protein
MFHRRAVVVRVIVQQDSDWAVHSIYAVGCFAKDASECRWQMLSKAWHGRTTFIALG